MEVKDMVTNVVTASLSHLAFDATMEKLDFKAQVAQLEQRLASVKANRDDWKRACETWQAKADERQAEIESAKTLMAMYVQAMKSSQEPDRTLQLLAHHLAKGEVTAEQVQEVLGVKRRSLSARTVTICELWDDAKKSAWKDDELLAHIAQTIDGEEWERTATLLRVPRAQARRKMVASVRRIIREGIAAGRVERRFASRQ